MSVFIPVYTNTLQPTPVECADSQTLKSIETTSIKQTQKPPMYKIIMLNDDFTPMDFVVYILESVFQKNNEDAISIMFEVHNKGSGNCGIFTYEIAESKKAQVLKIAQKYQYPLQCALEKS